MKDEECSIVIQINGRKRGLITMPTDVNENTVVEKAKTVENVIKNIENKKIIKTIFLKNKLINFITGK